MIEKYTTMGKKTNFLTAKMYITFRYPATFEDTMI